MTVNAQVPNITYTGNGIDDTFAFGFTILDNNDLKVFVDTVQQVEISDYTIQNLTENGGDVVFIVPPPDQSVVRLQRITSRTQQTDYEPFDAFPAETHEGALDKLTLITQELEQRFIDNDNPQVFSVFGRTGDVIADGSDYAEFYLDEAWPTGLYDGGELNIVSGTNIELIAGRGVVVDSYTDPTAVPVKTFLSWNTQDEPITSAPAVAGSIVRLLIADGNVPGPVPNTNLGVLVQQGTPASPSQLRDQIFLGVTIHNGASWKDVSSPVVVNNSAISLNEFARQVNGPSYPETGGAVHEAALFTLDRDAGTIWEMNRNWHVNKKDPNRESFLAQPGFQWRYTNRDFTDVGALTDTVDPTQYDVAGVVSPIPGGANTATVQRLFVDVADNYWVLWGQNTFGNYVEAVSSIGADAANTEVPHLLGGGSILLGFIVCEQGKTDWDTDEARFVEVVVATGGGATLPVQAWLDLNDTPSDYVGEAHKVPTVNAGESGLLFDNRMVFRGPWQAAEYNVGDTVFDIPYTMHANKTTTDRAAPQPIGSADFTLPTTPAWSNLQNTSTIGSGHTYTFNEFVEVLALRIWPPTTGGDIGYLLTIIVDGVLSQQPLVGLTAGQWNVVTANQRLFLPGQQLLAYLEAENSGSTSQVTGGWTRGANDNNNEPANQSWNRRNDNTLVRIDFTDLNTTDRQSELEGIIVGSTIQFVETAVPANFVTYRVTTPPTTLITSVSYGVVEIDRGVLEPPVGQTTTMTADIPIATPTDYVGITNNWAGNQPIWGTVESFLTFDGVNQGANPDNAYGVDIQVQRLDFSPDWDFVSKSAA